MPYHHGDLRRALLDTALEAITEHGPMALMQRKPRTPSGIPKLGGENEARLTALACSQPPRGLGRWSLWLLAERLVELEVVAAVSHETVRRALEASRGVKKDAAETMGISQRALSYYLAKHRLED